MKLLKQIGSGDIYVWTENLAARDDMVEFTHGEPQVEPEAQEMPAEEGNPSENSPNASADEPNAELSTAKAAFRRQVGKVGRKPSANQSGES